ncbi:MAG TPA: formate dehydrogenase accessory sulfurtransferase FdhD [Deltaproteobacteria bacterium]|nr:formate dehydrogenase accessory sulfurtransferase FdhD [Deltaproteobacteria bacterium]HOI08412.1 formate dehydrogenase accessory sulfurtransferase FdhD [Deltaproteobacteria bacterium]
MDKSDLEPNDAMYSAFPVKEIALTDDGVTLREQERQVIGEISLKVFINGEEFVSLLCLNQYPEDLALGFLFSEGVIDSMDDVAGVAYNDRLFAVTIDLAPGRAVSRCESLRSMTSGCGKCFTYINPLKQDKFQKAPVHEKFRITDILETMADFESRSELFRDIGGVHSVLFQGQGLSVFREDIGRHNCFDKIAGVLLRNGTLDSAGKGMMFVSGRISSEILTKVIRMGVPVVVSRSTPTAAAVNLALKYNITLMGYVRRTSGTIYSGDERLY